MMKRFLLPALLLAGLSCLGQAVTPLHIYFVPRTADSVAPENMHLDSVWNHVPDSAPFILNVPEKGKLSLKTVFRAVYNNKYLFVRVDAEEPLADRMDFSRGDIKRDSADVFKSSHVEFFLDSDLQQKSAAQVIFNVRGGIYDAIVCGGTPDWYYEASSRTEKRRNGWVMTAAFPFLDKGVAVSNIFGMFPHTNPVIGFNICRSPSQGGHLATQWNKTPANRYDTPNKYGILVMSGEKDAVSTLQNFLSRQQYNALSLEGAVKQAASIYRMALKKELESGFTNGRMLSEPRRSQVMAEFDSIRKALSGEKTESELAALLTQCRKLNDEIAEKQQSISSSILDEI